MSQSDEVSVLRKIILRLAEDATWALKQEGSAVHGHCEGHAVCDLVNGAIFAAGNISK